MLVLFQRRIDGLLFREDQFEPASLHPGHPRPAYSPRDNRLAVGQHISHVKGLTMLGGLLVRIRAQSAKYFPPFWVYVYNQESRRTP